MWVQAHTHTMTRIPSAVCAHEELSRKWAVGLTSEWSDSETRWPVSRRQELGTPRAALTATNLWLLNISPQGEILSAPPCTPRRPAENPDSTMSGCRGNTPCFMDSRVNLRVRVDVKQREAAVKEEEEEEEKGRTSEINQPVTCELTRPFFL